MIFVNKSSHHAVAIHQKEDETHPDPDNNP